jgi:hypothetical protein
MSDAARKWAGNVVDIGRVRTSKAKAKDAAPGEIRGHRIARLVGKGPRGPLVELAEAKGGQPVAARVSQSVDPVSLARAIAERQEALLVFESERADRPIIVGLLAPAGAPATARGDARAPVLEAIVDGDRLVLQGRDEIVLRCGDASITLRRNGRVVVRGTYVETRSAGVNRIKGGSVQIN